MDAVAPILIGVGLYLAYEAYKNPMPAPIQKFTAALNAGTVPTSGQTGFGVVTPGTTVNSAGVAQ